MPELPEVEVIRRSLAPRLLGRRAVSVDPRPARLRQGVDPSEWWPLQGMCVRTLERRGKYLLVGWENGLTTVFHLGMSGRLLLRPRGGEEPPHTHLVIGLEGGDELLLVDPRRFGMAVTLPPGPLAEFPPLLGLGAEPLTDGAGAVLVAAARRTRRAIHAVLLDQSVLAGLGNIYAGEAEARAGIRPFRPAGSISRDRLEGLARAIRAVLTEAVERGGTTLEDGGFVDSDGTNGAFAAELRTYGREGEACRRCRRPIRRRVVAGRSVYYCPACQR